MRNKAVITFCVNSEAKMGWYKLATRETDSEKNTSSLSRRTSG